MALTQSPTYPVAGDTVTVTSDASAVLLFDYAIELTSVPDLSSLSTGLLLVNTDSTVSDPIEAAKRSLLADSFVPDASGEYGVTVYVIQQRPPSRPGETEPRYGISATDSGTINVAVDLDLPVSSVRFGGGTLRIRVVNDTIRSASLVDFTTDAARAASLQTTVTDALTALEDVTVATAIGDPVARTNDLRSNMAAHFATVSFHNSVGDSTNTPVEDAAYSVEGIVTLLAALREYLVGHMLDAEAASRWHAGEDTLNLPVTASPTDLASATVALSDLRERAYERHRVMTSGDTPVVHDDATADTTNALTASTKLDDVIVAYLDALVDESPTAAAGEVDGAVTAANVAGFRLAS